MYQAYKLRYRISITALALGLFVRPSAAQDLIVEPCQLKFTAIADSAVLPPAQTSNFKSFSGASLAYHYFGASTLVGLNFVQAPLRIFPGSGITPDTALVSLDSQEVAKFAPSDLVYDLRFSTVILPPPYTVCSAQITILPAPRPVLTSVLNAATFQQSAIAPGEIVTILGTNIAPVDNITTVISVFLPSAT